MTRDKNAKSLLYSRVTGPRCLHCTLRRCLVGREVRSRSYVVLRSLPSRQVRPRWIQRQTVPGAWQVRRTLRYVHPWSVLGPLRLLVT